MKILTKDEVNVNKGVILEVIKNGAIFVYPTDTIYGIGCNARLSAAVKKIRKLKQRPDTPFSIIAPSKEWIADHCIVSKKAKEWINKLPGPYTLILKTKKHAAVKEVAPGLGTLGIRIPDNWFADIVKQLKIPVVTTSANISGEDFMTSLEDLSDEIKNNIEFIIYEGEKKASPSKLIDLTGKEAVVKER